MPIFDFMFQKYLTGLYLPLLYIFHLICSWKLILTGCSLRHYLTIWFVGDNKMRWFVHKNKRILTGCSLRVYPTRVEMPLQPQFYPSPGYILERLINHQYLSPWYFDSMVETLISSPIHCQNTLTINSSSNLCFLFLPAPSVKSPTKPWLLWNHKKLLCFSM